MEIPIMHYLDNSATTQVCPEAAQAALSAMTQDFGNPSSTHTVGREAKKLLDRSRASVASALGCTPAELIFTSCGSESDNWALLSGAESMKRRGNHIISSVAEHDAVRRSLDLLEERGFEVTRLKPGPSGAVSVDAVREALREDTILVSLMLVNNETGAVTDIAGVSAMLKAAGSQALLHTDAVQAVGHIPVNVVEDNIDLLSSSAHKFHGPKGVGFLYARRGIRLISLIEGGAQERGRRAGTENVPGIAAMAAALREAAAKMDESSAVITEKRDRLIKGLSEISHSALNGDAAKRLPGNVSFCFEGIEGESLLLLLDDKGICASSGSACTSGSLDPSHVLLAIGRVHDVAHGSLRLTIDETISDEDVDYIVSSVKEVVDYLRGFSPIWRDLCSGKKQFIL